LEIELAKIINRLVPGAEMVKFTKNGSTATSGAVKLARAYTKRDMIAMQAGSYNGSDDWGVAITPMTAGIPKAIQKLTVTFNFNDIESVKKLFKKYPKKIACVILEPATEVAPENNFLQKLKKLCRQNGAVLIFDEVISGFRWHVKGAGYVYKVTPDLATFGKAVANGFSVSALVGKKKIMKLGGMFGQHERVFLLSSTHGAENHALAAGIATLKELQKHNVPKHLDKIGKKLQKKLNAISQKYDLEKVINVFGIHGSRQAVSFQSKGKYSAALIKTYFFQEMIAQGILFNGYFSPSFSHKQKEINLTAKAWEKACQKLNTTFEKGNLKKKLIGKVVKLVFRKFN
jgi:glutamate-1-semialdehyde 2,1-aminomutase